MQNQNTSINNEQTSFEMVLLKNQEPVHSIPNHPCTLPLRTESVSHQITQGPFVQCRRRVWKWFTVYPTNLESKRYLKSVAQIHDEEILHFYYHPYMIHPFSQARVTWEMLMIPVWSALLVFIPITISSLTIGPYIEWAIAGLDVICLIDIILWFFTGYYDKSRRTTVMAFKKVATRYIFTYFIFDVISSQPIRLYQSVFRKLGFENGFNYLMLLLLLKVTRLPTLISYIQKFSNRARCCTFSIKFICFMLWLVILIVWIASAMYVVLKEGGYTALAKRQIEDAPMLFTVYRVTRGLMAIGITDFVNNNNFVMIVEIIVITMGSLLKIIILAKVMQFYQRRASSKNKYNHLLEEIGEFMKYKELAARLKDKILKYVDFKYQKHIFREEDVLENLSSVLKHDILLQRCQRMIAKVEFFKGLPPQAMLRIVTKLRSEIYLPNDVIVLAGYAGRAMYFIYAGSVAVYTGNGREICHLNDGSHFGEIALVINEPRVATVIAIKECELFKLSRKDFQEAIEPFPELNEKIRLLALSRLATTLQLMSEIQEERKFTVEMDSEEESSQ